MSAWSPVRSLQSLAKFFFISGAATATAWYAHPQLLDVAAHVLNLDFKDNVTAFQTSFFSFLSLVFAIYSGNTMAFLYDVSLLLPCSNPFESGDSHRSIPLCTCAISGMSHAMAGAEIEDVQHAEAKRGGEKSVCGVHGPGGAAGRGSQHSGS